MQFNYIYGVDFSGAKLAGRNTWVARVEPHAPNGSPQLYALTDLVRLEKLCGTAERTPALAHLVATIAESRRALWALDFPFGLPVEIMGARWAEQFDFLKVWGEDGYGAGLECVRRSEASHGRKHIRRLTDSEARAPFDPYHYRIIYQTFFGMRDVLNPLRRLAKTAVLPFQYRRLATADRVLVEACPSSTLKNLSLPHQNYKQPEGGALTRKRLKTRRVIMDGVAQHLLITDTHRRVMMRNGGADALDAIIAALGAATAWAAADHRAIARHPRYPREGRLYV